MTDQDIKTIEYLYNQGVSPEEISEETGIYVKEIYYIVDYMDYQNERED